MKKLTLILLLASLLPCFAGLNEIKQYGLSNAVAVTKSDTTTYSPPLRMLFFSATAGQIIKVDMAETGTAIQFVYGAAGSYVLPVSVTRVWSTTTTVTGIVGLY